MGDKFKQGGPRFALPGTTKESRGEILRESTPGELRRVAVSLQNCRGSKKRSAKGLDRAVATGEGLHEDVTDGRGGDTVTERPPPPGLGPQSLTCGARAPWAPPASGTAAAGRKKKPITSCFRARNPEATPTLQARPHALEQLLLPGRASPKTERATSGSRGSSREIWRARVLAPPGVQFFPLNAPRSSSGSFPTCQTERGNGFIQQAFLAPPAARQEAC